MYCFVKRFLLSGSRRLASWLLAFALLPSISGHAHGEALASTYIKLYGLTDVSENTTYQRVQEIFDVLRHISGMATRGSKLVIVKSNDTPWAVALADGNVVLSQGAIDIIYGITDKRVSDVWMAYVLGHELAHLKNSDLWHHQVREVLLKSHNPSMRELGSTLYRGSRDPAQLQARELKADRDGFLYAVLAGFDTSLLLSSEALDNGFLDYWVLQTGTRNSLEHPDPATRTEFMKTQLEMLSAEVEFFHYSVRLAYFGRFEDSLILMRKFQKNFQSSAVLNNLGYLYLQVARQKMPESLAYRFWFPTLLEAESGIRVLSAQSRSVPGARPSEGVVRDLEEAVLLLTAAMNSTGADVATFLNLSIAYWYLGDIFDARATVEKALKIWNNDTRLLAMRAMILLEERPAYEVDTWSVARDQLSGLLARGEQSAYVLYNMAQLLEERGRSGDARKYWESVASLFSVPARYRLRACRALSRECGLATKNTGLKGPPWSIPVRIGSDIHDQETLIALRKWTHLNAKLDNTRVDIFIGSNGNSVLALDHIVEMYSAETEWSLQQLEEYGGFPHTTLQLSAGEFRRFGDHWGFHTSDGTVREVVVAGN